MSNERVVRICGASLPFLAYHMTYPRKPQPATDSTFPNSLDGTPLRGSLLFIYLLQFCILPDKVHDIRPWSFIRGHLG